MPLSQADRELLLRTLQSQAHHFGPGLERATAEKGLAVTKPDGGVTPIPVTATPVIFSAQELAKRQREATLLASAGHKMAQTALLETHPALIHGGLSPVEQRLATATAPALRTLVTTRVDFFNGPEGLKALELNATIPAMQAYSDIAAHSFIEAVCRHFEVKEHTIARWQADNGSNALALFRALLGGMASFGRPAPERMAILTRRNDAQISELKYLAARFAEWGCEADIVYPDQLSGTDAVIANGKRYPLVYRHLFVRRLEEPGMEGAAYVEALLSEPNGTRAVVLNPPASHVEAKAVFALLSQATEDAALAKAAGLTAEELEAISAAVPWTRIFDQSLVAAVSADPEAYVLKRSWDYGGRAVFIGASRDTPGFAERTQLAYGEALSWEATCAKAVADSRGGGFVVQRLVRPTAEQHLLMSNGTPTPVDLFVDFSTYASVGLESQPKWGGVCRGSIQQVVNIVGGGGVLPLITEETAERLVTAAKARGFVS